MSSSLQYGSISRLPSFLLRERANKAGNVDAKPLEQVVKGFVNCSRLLFQRARHVLRVEFV
jgi:hypothetical protein